MTKYTVEWPTDRKEILALCEQIEGDIGLQHMDRQELQFICKRLNVSDKGSNVALANRLIREISKG